MKQVEVQRSIKSATTLEGPTELQQVYDFLRLHHSRAVLHSCVSEDKFGYLFSGALLSLTQNVYTLSLLLKAELTAQALVIGRVSYEIGMRSKWAAFTEDGAQRLVKSFIRSSIHTLELAAAEKSIPTEAQSQAASMVFDFRREIAVFDPNDSLKNVPDMREIVKKVSSLRMRLGVGYVHSGSYCIPSAAVHGDPAPYRDSDNPEARRLATMLVWDGAIGAVEAFHRRYPQATDGLADAIEEIFGVARGSEKA